MGDNKMTPSETERLTGILRAKQMELSGVLSNRDEIAVDRASDTFDQVQLMSERELAIRTLARDSDLQRQIRRALARIAAGVYGVCVYCEEDIPARRMATVPWAGFCINCQERIDRREIEVDENVERLVPAA
jgi:DnaK suppressor protein